MRATALGLLLLGCSDYGVTGKVIIEVHDSGDPDAEGEADGGVDTEAPPDDTDDTSPPDDTAPPDESCAVPVADHVDLEDVVWGETGVHFYVADPGWAFAAVHGWRLSQGLAEADIGLELRPAWYFATGLKESFWGCSDSAAADSEHSAAWARQTAADADGCLQMEATTAWIEICRMYPDDVDCDAVSHADVVSSADQASTGRDNVTTSMLAATYFNLFGYAMLTNHGLADPDAWFAAAADPQAQLKMVALVYNRGAWSTEIDAVIDGCASAPIEDCVTAGSVAQDYVTAVGAYADQMEAAVSRGDCYDDTVYESDVEAWLLSLEPMFPEEDWQAVGLRARAAFLSASGGSAGASFQEVALPVVDAVIGEMAAGLACPADMLDSYYSADCPI